MVHGKSRGPRRGTRKKYSKNRRVTVNQYLRKFKEGDKVALKTESASQGGMPFRRFHGLTGTVVGKRGKAYLVTIKDGKKLKKIISNPEHLKKV